MHAQRGMFCLFLFLSFLIYFLLLILSVSACMQEETKVKERARGRRLWTEICPAVQQKQKPKGRTKRLLIIVFILICILRFVYLLFTCFSTIHSALHLQSRMDGGKTRKCVKCQKMANSLERNTLWKRPGIRETQNLAPRNFGATTSYWSCL